MHLLYLHGFSSSPASHKARLTAGWLARHHPEVEFICPTLSPRPPEAADQIEAATRHCDWSRTLVMGSSMGGFFATWVAETHGCKAVLINPAVRPWRGRAYLLGEQTNYHTGETFIMRPEDIEGFAHYGVTTLSHPEHFWVLLQTGDEVLDYRRAVEHYQGCHVTVEEGGDHGFQGLERFLPEIMKFWTKGL